MGRYYEFLLLNYCASARNGSPSECLHHLSVQQEKLARHELPAALDFASLSSASAFAMSFGMPIPSRWKPARTRFRSGRSSSASSVSRCSTVAQSTKDQASGRPAARARQARTHSPGLRQSRSKARALGSSLKPRPRSERGAPYCDASSLPLSAARRYSISARAGSGSAPATPFSIRRACPTRRRAIHPLPRSRCNAPALRTDQPACRGRSRRRGRRSPAGEIARFLSCRR